MTNGQIRLTVAVIARDEEDDLPDCLRSVHWADELLVLVDAATRDRTREVARGLGARVFEEPFRNFAIQRGRALELSQGEWVLFVDADERVTTQLRQEVVSAIREPRGHVGFWIPRHNVLMGRLVRGAGWYPDYQLRLLRRDAARFDPMRVVHEVPVLNGSAGYLTQPFIHLNYRTLAEFVSKQERYCSLEAERWLRTHGRPRRRAIVGQPARELWRRYVTLGGYREGGLGLLLSALLAFYAGKAVWRARRLSDPPPPAAPGST